MMRLSPDFGGQWLTHYALQGAGKHKVIKVRGDIDRAHRLDKKLTENKIVIDNTAADELHQLYAAIPEEFRLQLFNPAVEMSLTDFGAHFSPFIDRAEELAAPFAEPFIDEKGDMPAWIKRSIEGVLALPPLLQIEFFRAMASRVE